MYTYIYKTHSKQGKLTVMRNFAYLETKNNNKSSEWNRHCTLYG